MTLIKHGEMGERKSMEIQSLDPRRRWSQAIISHTSKCLVFVADNPNRALAPLLRHSGAIRRLFGSIGGMRFYDHGTISLKRNMGFSNKVL